MLLQDTKVCGECGVEQPLANFHKKRNGKTSQCKECKAKYNRRRKYGLTAEELEYLESVELCQICFGVAECIDHCHSSGRIRGVLCHSCNHMLGKSKDSPDVLRAAAKYLEENCEAGQFLTSYKSYPQAEGA